MMFGPLLMAVIGLMVVMAIAWVVHRRTKNAGWIDALWTFGTGLSGSVAALVPRAERHLGDLPQHDRLVEAVGHDQVAQHLQLG